MWALLLLVKSLNFVLFGNLKESIPQLLFVERMDICIMFEILFFFSCVSERKLFTIRIQFQFYVQDLKEGWKHDGESFKIAGQIAPESDIFAEFEIGRTHSCVIFKGEDQKLHHFYVEGAWVHETEEFAFKFSFFSFSKLLCSFSKKISVSKFRYWKNCCNVRAKFERNRNSWLEQGRQTQIPLFEWNFMDLRFKCFESTELKNNSSKNNKCETLFFKWNAQIVKAAAQNMTDKSISKSNTRFLKWFVSLPGDVSAQMPDSLGADLVNLQVHERVICFHCIPQVFHTFNWKPSFQQIELWKKRCKSASQKKEKLISPTFASVLFTFRAAARNLILSSLNKLLLRSISRRLLLKCKDSAKYNNPSSSIAELSKQKDKEN